MANQEMPRFDMSKEFSKLTDSDKFYMKKMEALNLRRATDNKIMRVNGRRLSLGLGALVIGIYSYTIYSMKQEKFLDFDQMPPEKK